MVARITNAVCPANVKVFLSTFQHRSFELADNGIVFAPQSGIWYDRLNYIANYIIQRRNAVKWDFFYKACESA